MKLFVNADNQLELSEGSNFLASWNNLTFLHPNYKGVGVPAVELNFVNTVLEIAYQAGKVEGEERLAKVRQILKD